MTTFFTIKTQEESQSVSFGTRQLGDSGVDVLAAKIALGILVPGNVVSQQSPTDPAILSGQNWFDCVDNEFVSLELSSKFDSKMQSALMKFQIENQFYIIDYLLNKNSIHEDVLSAEIPENTDQELVQSTLIVASADSLFDQEFGTLGEATLSIMHGWLPGTTFQNDSFIHPLSFDTELIYHVVPKIIYRNFAFEKYGQIPSINSEILDPQFSLRPGEDESGLTLGDFELLREAKSQSIQEYSWAPALEYGIITLQPRTLESGRSVLSVATSDAISTINTIPPSERTSDILTEQEKREFLDRAFTPNHRIDPDPFVLDNKIIVMVDTDYTFFHNPPTVPDDDETLELESRAITEAVKFFDRPYIWYLQSDEPEFEEYYPMLNKSGVTPPSGSLRWQLSTNELIAEIGQISRTYVEKKTIQTYDVIESSSDEKLAKFISFRTPSYRRGDTYRAEIHINRELFDLIKIGETEEDIRATPINQDNYDDRISALDKARAERHCVDDAPLGDRNSEQKFEEYRQFAQVQKKELIRLIRSKAMDAISNGQGNINVDLGVFGNINIDVDNWFDSAGDVLNLIPSISTIGPKREEEEVDTKKTLTIRFSDLEIKCKRVARKLRESEEDLKTITVNDPSFSVRSEANDLESVPAAIKALYEAALDDEKVPEGLLDNVGIMSPELVLKFRATSRGQILEQIFIKGKNIPINTDKKGRRELRKPLNRERTVHYLSRLNDMDTIPFIGGIPGCDVSSGIAGSAFIVRYTKGLSIIDTGESPLNPVHEWADETFVEPIEDLRAAATRANKNRGEYSWLYSGVDYGTAVALPIISETCTYAEIKHKFLDTFSLQALLCDVAACLRLPAVQIKAPSFYLPPPPGMPSFSLPDMSELAKKLQDLVLQILTKLVCTIANGILDILSTPWCATALEEQLASPELNSDFDVPRRALVEALVGLDIPTDSDTLEQIKSLIDDLLSMLTPSELCALLTGQTVSNEVTAIVSRLAQIQGTSASEALSTPEKIKSFFESLGLFIDEEFCQRLGSMDDLLGTYTCSDTASLLNIVREKLQSEDIPDSEVIKAIENSRSELFDQSRALQLISDPEALAAFFPESTFPGAFGSGIKEFPRSVKVAAQRTAKTVLSPVKMSYMSSLRNYGSSLYLQSTAPADPNDANYNFDARLQLERSTQRIQSYTKYLEDKNKGLNELTTRELKEVLYRLCEKFQEVQHGPGSEEDGDQNFVHVKEYVILNANGDQIGEAHPYTTQQELKYRYNQVPSSGSVNVNLKSRSPVFYDEMLMVPIILSRVVDEDKIQIRTREELYRLADPQYGPEDPKGITIKQALMDKINERLLGISQIIQENIEKATSSTQKSDLLYLLRDIYDSNRETILEGSGNELIKSVIEPSFFSVEIGDSVSGRLVKLEEEPSPAGLDKFNIRISDVNSFDEDVTFRYCEQLPQKYVSVFEDSQTEELSTRDEKFEYFFSESLKKVMSATAASTPQEIQAFTDLFLSNNFNNMAPVVYRRLLEGVLEQVFFLFDGSKVFDEQYTTELIKRVAGEIIFNEKEDGTFCVSNKYEFAADATLSFERLISKDFAQELALEFGKKENNPALLDFSAPGPVEKALMNLIVKGLVRIIILETLLKGAITFSTLPMKLVFTERFFKDYMLQYVFREFRTIDMISSPEQQLLVKQALQRVTGLSKVEDAITKIVNSELPLFLDIANEIYETEEVGSIEDFYINNLENVNISSTPSENPSAEWKLEEIDYDTGNPFFHIENYIRIKGDLADPEFYERNVNFAEVLDFYNENSPGVYAPLNYSSPDLSFLLSHINRGGVSPEVSFLLDAKNKDEILSIDDLERLIRAFLSDNREPIRRAEYVLKDLFGTNENDPESLHGLPRVLEKIPAGLHKVKRAHIKLSNTDVFNFRRDKFTVSDRTDRRELLQSSISSVVIQGDKYFSSNISGIDSAAQIQAASSDPDLQRIPEQGDSRTQLRFHPFKELVETREKKSIISDEIGNPRGFERERYHSLSERLVQTEKIITNEQNGEVLFHPPVYGEVTREEYENTELSSNIKEVIEETVVDTMGDSTIIFDLIGESTGFTQSDFEVAFINSPEEFKQSYRSNSAVIKKIFEIESKTKALLNTKKDNSLLSFVPEGQRLAGLCIMNGDICAASDYTYIQGHRDPQRLYHETHRPESPTSAGGVYHMNQYEIPTRMLISRIMSNEQDTLELMSPSEECYVKYVIPEFFETSNTQRTQICLQMWGELLDNYVQGIQRAMSVLLQSDADGSISDAIMSNFPSDEEKIKRMYEYVLQNDPNFPDFYDVFDSSRPNFVSREKIYSIICKREAESSTGAFEESYNFVSNQFGNRGKLLKKTKNNSPILPAEQTLKSNEEQHKLDKMKYAGQIYDTNLHTMFKNLKNDVTHDDFAESLRINNSVTSIYFSLQSFVDWFRQRRNDSFWGLTYRKEPSQRNNPAFNPNIGVEYPGILCGASPFFCDGRFSVAELNSTTEAIKMYLDANTEGGLTERQANLLRTTREKIIYEIEEYRNSIDSQLSTNLYPLWAEQPMNSATPYLDIRKAFFVDTYLGYSRDTTNSEGTVDSHEGSSLSVSKRLKTRLGAVTYSAWSMITNISAAGLSADYSDSISPDFLNPNRAPYKLVSLDPEHEIGTSLRQDMENNYEIDAVIQASDEPWKGPLWHLFTMGLIDRVTTRELIRNSPISSYYDSENFRLFNPENQAIDDLVNFCFYTSRDAKFYPAGKRIHTKGSAIAASIDTITTQWSNAMIATGINKLAQDLYGVFDNSFDAAQEYLGNIFSRTEFFQGARLVLSMPDTGEAPIVSPAARSNSVYRDFSQELRTGALETATGKLMESYPVAFYEQQIDLENICPNPIENIMQFKRFFNSPQQKSLRFEELRKGDDFKTYFEYLLPISKFTSMGAIYNTALLGSYNTFPSFFDTTKNTLAGMMSLVSKRDSYYDLNPLDSYGAPGIDNASLLDLMVKNLRPGSGEECFGFPADFGMYMDMVAEMVEELVKFAPSIILRGIADQIDPAYKEMKHHWNSCHLDGFSWVGNGRGPVVTYSSGGKKLPLGLNGGRKKDGQSTYAPVNVAFPVDLTRAILTVFSSPGKSARLMQASVSKLVTYIFAGSLPFLDPSYAFKIPCKDRDNSGDFGGDWAKFDVGRFGRYGHPLSLFTLLALSTPIMRKDLKNKDFNCKVLASPVAGAIDSKEDLGEC